MKSAIIFTSVLAAIAEAAPPQHCITSAPPQNVHDPLLNSLDAVYPPLTTMISLVGAYRDSDGLVGALGIQESYYPLYRSVMSLSAAAASNHHTVAPNDVVIYVSALNTLISDISTLMSSLNQKANIFHSVGAGDIVISDITSLAGPASAILSNIFTRIPNDAPCAQITSAGSVASDFSAVFEGAAQVYKINSGIPKFPVGPTNCAVYC